LIYRNLEFLSLQRLIGYEIIKILYISVKRTCKCAYMGFCFIESISN
jgi:hypothetical protein